MKRIQLFEFEDFDWFPDTWRAGITRLIVVFHKMMGTKEVLSALLEDIQRRHPFSRIVDLGSGSGGIMPEVVQEMNSKREGHAVELVLTDLHPNPDYLRLFNGAEPRYISYRESSLDATQLSQAPEGLKTMANSFHHMPPDQARKILQSAQGTGEPLLIYEMGENNIPTLLWWLLLPLSLAILIVMVLFMTPFVRPLSWQQLLFTYLIPVIPLTYAWDGQASLVRMYTFDDVEQLLEGIRHENYSWEMGPAKKGNGKKSGYYILGLPK